MKYSLCDDWSFTENWSQAFAQGENVPVQAVRLPHNCRELDAAYGSGEHAGCFGWCMFDYATHKDFGSGDRICYHGVLDSFRNPKLAASVYGSQGEAPTLTVTSSMDIGDYPAGQVGKVYVFTNADTVDLYGKYVGNWGGEATRWRFDAKCGGKTVKSVTLCPSAALHLEVRPTATALREGYTYDMAAVRIRVLDENGNLAPYAQLPLHFDLSGCGQLVGPETAVAEGGMGGTYLRTDGHSGEGVLTVSAPGCEPVSIGFTMTGRD